MYLGNVNVHSKLRSFAKAVRALVYFLCTVSCLNSCSPDRQEGKQVFHWNIHSGITSLDPAFARSQSNIWVCNQIYDGLLQLNENMKPIPALARRWEVSPDGMTYTFYLKDNVYFHEHEQFEGGRRKLVAADVVFSFNRILNPRVASPGAWIFNDKVKAYDPDIQGSPSFRAPREDVFVLELTRPFPPLPGLLTMQYCNIVPREVVEHYGQDFGRHPVGAGPFRMAFWEPQTQLILHPHGHFYELDAQGNRLPYLDAVSITFIPSKQNEFLAFLNGKLDFLSGLDASFKDHLLSADGQLRARWEGKFELEKNPFLNTEYLGFLLAPEKMPKGHPLLDRRIRQAINYGYSRRKMLRYLRNGIGRPGRHGIIPPGLPAFDSNEVYSYKPAKARALLVEAGYPGGKGLPEIELHTNASYLDLCIFIQKELGQIGIPVKVKVHPPSTLREWVAQGKMGFFRASWIADYPDAENYISLFYSGNFAPNGPNYTRYQDPQADTLYLRAMRTTQSNVREQLYRQMEDQVMQDAPVTVLYYDEVVRLIPPHLKGINHNPINLIDLKKVSVN